MPKSIVSIAKGTDPELMVHEALSFLGGVDALIKPNSRVVVKPNAGHMATPETSVNTSPEVVAAVIKELRKARPREIILAEAAAIGCDTWQCFEMSGIGKAAEEAGVDRILDIKSDRDLISVPIADARSAMSRVLIPRFLLEADHVVNVPIFKAHVSMVFTCALKNIKGVVQDKVHYQMHQTVLADAMMDLWSVLRDKVDLSIVDMIRPAEGFGPQATIPADFGCIVAGRDAVAVDATICRMVGLDVGEVPYFEPARDRGVGVFDEESVEVRGKTIQEVFKRLWIPYLGGFQQWPEYNILADNSCSSCQGLLAYTMETLKAIGAYDVNAGITIMIGRKKELPEGVDPQNLILIGDCLQRYRGRGAFVGGCPPGEPFALFAVMDRQDHTDAATEIAAGARERFEAIGPVFQAYMCKLREQARAAGTDH